MDQEGVTGEVALGGGGSGRRRLSAEKNGDAGGSNFLIESNSDRPGRESCEMKINTQNGGWVRRWR